MHVLKLCDYFNIIFAYLSFLIFFCDILRDFVQFMGDTFYFKGALSGLRQFLATESPLGKMVFILP